MSANIIAGFLLGLCSALFFAFYMVPQKLTKVDHTTFLWTMGVGVLFTTGLPYLFAGCPLNATWTERGEAILCGCVWGCATLALTASIRHIGLALATPIKNTTGVLGTLVGLIFFAEYRTTNPWLCLSGSILIVLAAVVIGTAGKKGEGMRSAIGVWYALLAALGYAGNLFLLKLVITRIGYVEFTPLMALGILLIATIAVVTRPGGVREALRYTTRDYLITLGGGVAWGIAMISMAASMTYVGLAVSWALAQLNTVPAVVMGIITFRELRFRDEWKKIVIGLLAAIVGTILLAWSK